MQQRIHTNKIDTYHCTIRRFDRWSKVIAKICVCWKSENALGTKSTHFSIFYVPHVHVPRALGTHLRAVITLYQKLHYIVKEPRHFRTGPKWYPVLNNRKSWSKAKGISLHREETDAALGLQRSYLQQWSVVDDILLLPSKVFSLLSIGKVSGVGGIVRWRHRSIPHIISYCDHFLMYDLSTHNT